MNLPKATEMTMEHYQRPEIKAAIVNYCRVSGGMRALNASEKWYKGGKDPETVMLRGPDDYDETLEKGRPLYATLDLMETPVFQKAEKWIEKTGRPENPIGDLSNCIGFTLSTDIDAVGEIRSNLRVKEAVEAAAQFHVDYLREAGIENSVYCLYSGGGVYVHIHHGLFSVDVGNTELEPAQIMEEYQVICKAYNKLIGDISKEFFRKHPEHIGRVKFDQLNNQKRTFKTIFSLHKSLPFAVVPLDPKKIKIDFKKASVPLSSEVLAEGVTWYQTFDPSEKRAMVMLLKDRMAEVRTIIKSRPTGNGSISRAETPIELEKFPPCMRNIIANAQEVEGRHRALGVLATYLYQAGWEEEKAFDLWAKVADRCGVEPRIFETEWGRVSCPRCSTMNRDTGGYPSLNLYKMGFCNSDLGCLNAVWPGEYGKTVEKERVQPVHNEERIRVTLGADLAANIDDSLSALYENNVPPAIFQRTGSLCRIKPVGEGRFKIEEINDYALRTDMSRATTFEKFDGEEYTECRAPLDLARGILTLTSWDFPALSGLINSPVVRSDGSLLTNPGYDAATGLYYAPDPALKLPEIPENLTMEDARDAANFILDEVLHDFPFVDEASKANTLAAFLSPVVRPMVEGCVPMALIDKPAPGTGASKILDLISIISTGRPMAALSPPNDDDEWRKLITGNMRDGSPLICLDNIASDLKADSLARVLSSSIWKDRTLGKPDATEYPQRACWYATGNNLTLNGDIPRRSFLIQLDAKMARPWERTKFIHPDINKWVKENRGEILSKLLIMAGAWAANDRPNGPGLIIGGFDEWVEVLGGILRFAGLDQFLGNLTKLYEEVDVGSDEWAEFFGAWFKEYKNVGKTTSELLVDMRNAYVSISKVVPSEMAEKIKYNTPGDAKRVGVLLRKKLNVRYRYGKQNIMLVQEEGDKHANVRLWKVTEAKDNAIA